MPRASDCRGTLNQPPSMLTRTPSNSSTSLLAYSLRFVANHFAFAFARARQRAMTEEPVRQHVVAAACR